MSSKSLALAILIASTSLAFAGQQYQHYFNDRFGVSADVPQGWSSGAEPDNGDGLRWTSPDGAAEVAVYGGFQVLDSLEEAFKTEDAGYVAHARRVIARAKVRRMGRAQRNPSSSRM